MSNREYFRINVSSNTDSSSSQATIGDNPKPAKIDLLLPANLVSPLNPPKSVKMQVSKCRLSMNNLDDLTIPVDTEHSILDLNPGRQRISLYTKGLVTIMPYAPATNATGVFLPPRITPDEPFREYSRTPPYEHIQRVRIPVADLGADFTERLDNARKILAAGEYSYKKLRQFTDAVCDAHDGAREWLLPLGNHLTNIVIERDKLGIRIDTLGMRRYALPFNRNTTQYMSMPPDGSGAEYDASYTLNVKNDGTDPHPLPVPSHHDSTWRQIYPYSIIVNRYVAEALSVLPWKKYDNNSIPAAVQIPGWTASNFNDSTFYLLDTSQSRLTLEQSTPGWSEVFCTYPDEDPFYTDEVRYKSTKATYWFDDIPTVLFNQVQSIIILVNGMNTIPQVHPINLRQRQGSSIVTSIPVAELYYPLAGSLDEIKDDMIITHESFEDEPTITITPQDLQQRVISFQAAYIDKKGTLRYINLNPFDVFCMQITFCLYY